MTALCVRQGVQGSRQVCAERWKDSSCSCCRGDQETARLRPAHRGHCSRGCRHRGTGQPASLRRSRIQRGTAAAHRAILEVLPWSRCCVPTRSRSSRWRAAHVMPSAVLRRAVSEDRGGTRARQGPGLRACTHLLLHPMQDSSTIRHACEQLLTLTIRATRDRLVDCPRPARHSALETFTIRVTPSRGRRTTSRGSPRGHQQQQSQPPRSPRSRRSRGRSCSRRRTRMCLPGCRGCSQSRTQSMWAL